MSCAILNQRSSTVAAILDYQAVAVRQVGAVPLDLMDAPHQPDFSAVRLDDGQRWRWRWCGRRWWCGRRCWIWPPQYLPPVFVRTINAKSAPNDHFTAGPDCRVRISASGSVSSAGGCPTIRAGIISPAGVQIVITLAPPHTIITLPVQTAV